MLGKMVIPLADYGKNFYVRSCELCKPVNFRIVNLRDGRPYTGKVVTIDPRTKSIIVDTSRPMFVRLGVEAYYGTAKETQCSFIKPIRYGLMFKVCGDESLRLADRSPLEVNVTLGKDKDLAWDLRKIERQFSVSNPMCKMRI